MKANNSLRIISALLLLILGLLTLFLSTSIIFDWFGIREKEGNYILFIVVANFICSVLYLLAAFGFLKVKKWTFVLLQSATFILIFSFLMLGIHISNGDVYENKTVGAMVFRTSLTIGFTLL